MLCQTDIYKYTDITTQRNGIWENNAEMDLPQVGWKCIDRTDLAEDMDRRWVIMNAVLNLQVP
jgi:hypothetical protein